MASLDYPNIVCCLDVVVCKRLGIVMPYGGETLRQRIKTHGGQIPNWLPLTSQLMGAVAYLHANDVIHTDLKPMNAVVDTEDHLVVIDLGSCVVDRRDHRHLWLPRFEKLPVIPCGTIWYRAPETLLGWAHIHKSVDIWAAGCTIWEMWVGSTLFNAYTQTGMLKKIFSQLGLPKKGDDALGFFLTLPNWRRDLSQCGAARRPMSWKQRLAISCPSKAYGHWLAEMLALLPTDRPSADSGQAALLCLD